MSLATPAPTCVGGCCRGNDCSRSRITLRPRSETRELLEISTACAALCRSESWWCSRLMHCVLWWCVARIRPVGEALRALVAHFTRARQKA
jgi:hypothetical protein